jgi:hypothetical protein
VHVKLGPVWLDEPAKRLRVARSRARQQIGRHRAILLLAGREPPVVARTVIE